MASDMGLVEPDLVIYVHVDVTAVAQRDGYGQERYERVDFQTNVARVFDAMRADNLIWKTVDGMRSVDDVHADVLALALDAIHGIGDSPLCDTLFMHQQ
jgi:dTMP kinase